MLAWLVLTVKLVAVPVVVQVTPPEPVKPGSPLHAPEALYVLLSTKYASWAVAALRPSAATRALKPRERYAENCGIAIAARMPMIATTTSSSISVKPLARLRSLLVDVVPMCPPLGRDWLPSSVRRHPSMTAPGLTTGRYVELTRPPITTPRKRITAGSRRDIRLFTMLSTSSS